MSGENVRGNKEVIKPAEVKIKTVECLKCEKDFDTAIDTHGGYRHICPSCTVSNEQYGLRAEIVMMFDVDNKGYHTE